MSEKGRTVEYQKNIPVFHQISTAEPEYDSSPSTESSLMNQLHNCICMRGFPTPKTNRDKGHL